MRFLIIQTAFLGDVILATPLVEKLHQFYPEAKIDFLLRKGNEGLLLNNPHINELLIWNKKESKLANFLKIIRKVRAYRYDTVINIHRFTSSGLICLFSGAKQKIGFNKNPFSFFYTKKVKHSVSQAKHEIQRNLELINNLTDDKIVYPKLYPSEKDFITVERYKKINNSKLRYICIAPTSVWFTKQFPLEKWVDFIKNINSNYKIYLIGSLLDREVCELIKSQANNMQCKNLAGTLSLLETAALIRDAEMNFVNDSAPLHIASAMNAPTRAIFCSTSPSFGFGPLATNSKVLEVKATLECKPCGLHGFNSCPKKHFLCAYNIETNDLINEVPA